MDNESIQKFLTEKDKLEPAIATETQPNESKIEETPVSVSFFDETTASFIFICLISFLFLFKVWKFRPERVVRDTLEHFSQVPCRNCRFFSQNSYLRCAVHPSIVLTTQASDCTDYLPKNGNLDRSTRR
jgi:hypothetical protein